MKKKNARKENIIKSSSEGLPRNVVLAREGYTDDAPMLEPTPANTRAMTERLRGKLLIQAAPKAIRFLMDIVNDGLTKMSRDEPIGRHHVDAAKTLLDRSGIGPTTTEPANHSKEVGEMSGEELREHLEKIKREVADRAKTVIDAEPTIKEPPESLDFLD